MNSAAEAEPAAASEASRKPRRKVDLTGHGLLENGSTFPISVLDLSYDGCQIETPVALFPGLRLKMSVLRLGALDATVRWYSAGKAGLCFQPDPAPAAAQQPRREERVKISAQVSLRRAGRQQYTARVFDLSPVGCKVEFIERPKVGEDLWARFEGLDSFEGRVRWVDGFYGGIEFTRPIYAPVFALLLARLRG